MTRKNVYRLVLSLLATGGVAYLVVNSYNEISRFRFTYNWPMLVVAFFLEVLAYLCRFRIWLGITDELDLKTSKLAAARGYFLSTLGKYIPGNVGLFLARVEAYRGYSRSRVAVAAIVEYVATIASSCLLVVIGLAAAPFSVPPGIRLGAGALAVVLLISLHQRFLLGLINRVLSLAKRKPVRSFPSWSMQVRFVLAFILVGLLQGMAMFVVLNALHPTSFDNYLAITGAYYAAGLIGLAIVFAPSGIGVREGVLMLILPSMVPRPVAIVSTVLIRLVATSGELVLAGLFSLKRRNKAAGSADS